MGWGWPGSSPRPPLHPPHFPLVGTELHPWGGLRPSSYTERDEHKIQHCFCYTSTVLTSTLAFQKEQKLKCECQVSPPHSLPAAQHPWVPP